MNPELLHETVDHVAPKLKVLTVDSNASLGEAFAILAKNNIYSAPIYNASKKEILGFLDMMDVVMYIVQIVEKEATDDDEVPLAEKDLYDLLDQVSKFRTEKAVTVADISSRNALCTINHKATMSEALKTLYNVKTHRLLVLENPWTIVSILSQSDVAAWLDKHIKVHAQNPNTAHPLGSLGKKSAAELFNLNEHRVISIRADAQAIEAFRIMAHSNISSVAVVDEFGCLLGGLSAKDIKVIEPDALFTKLYKTCSEVMAITRPHLKTNFPLHFCHPTDTLEDIIHRLAFLRIHRVFVVDQEKKPISVISITDIIRVLSVNDIIRGLLGSRN